MIETKVIVNLNGLKKFADLIEKGLVGGVGPICDAMKKWGIRYRSAMQERFDIFSKGGGNWKELKESTKRARRHGKGGRFKRGKRAYAKAIATGGGQISILRDIGILFNVLDPVLTGKPGQYEDKVPYGIRVGYGGAASHPGGRATIAEIASYHQTGVKGRLPKREILVKPPDQVRQLMVHDMVDGLQKAIAMSAI